MAQAKCMLEVYYRPVEPYMTIAHRVWRVLALAPPAPTGRVCACRYPASCLIHRNFGGLSGVSPAAQAELGLSRTIRVESPLYPFAIPVSGECQEEVTSNGSSRWTPSLTALRLRNPCPRQWTG